MGKLALLLVTTALIGGTILIAQTHVTNVKTNERHAERQEEMLAREIARSGYNELLADARAYERAHPSATIQQIVDAINAGGTNGWTRRNFQGGYYRTRVVMASPSSYGIEANGYFGDAVHGVEEPHLRKGTLVIQQPSKFEAEFLESRAGYCSGVYLQRSVPKSFDDGTGKVDGVPVVGNTAGGNYLLLEPELVFVSGHNRDGAVAKYTTVLRPGTQLNFILAVDKNCKLQNKVAAISDKKYDYNYPALLDGADDLGEMRETQYAMVEQHPTNPALYRVAFEDLYDKFTPAQYLDLKANGYGDMKWKKRANGKESYGGSGWSRRNGRGYYELQDTSNSPDFSDQVFEIKITDAVASN